MFQSRAGVATIAGPRWRRQKQTMLQPKGITLYRRRQAWVRVRSPRVAATCMSFTVAEV